MRAQHLRLLIGRSSLIKLARLTQRGRKIAPMRCLAGLRIGQLSVVRQSLGESSLRSQSDSQNHQCGHIIRLLLQTCTSTCLSILVTARLKGALQCRNSWKIHSVPIQKNARGLRAARRSG